MCEKCSWVAYNVPQIWKWTQMTLIYLKLFLMIYKAGKFSLLYKKTYKVNN
jgi:hypothetical protein